MRASLRALVLKPSSTKIATVSVSVRRRLEYAFKIIARSYSESLIKRRDDSPISFILRLNVRTVRGIPVASSI